jgi:hypothetical protein
MQRAQVHDQSSFAPHLCDGSVMSLTDIAPRGKPKRPDFGGFAPLYPMQTDSYMSVVIIPETRCAALTACST